MIEPNPHYVDVPPLGILENQAGTPFATEEPGKPLWTSFTENPDRYAFLTQAEAALKRFTPVR